MRIVLVAALGCTLLACGKKSAPADASATPAATAVNAPAAAARPAPGGGFVTPPLGAPDAIEPPARDIVPGMLIRVAKEKGAKPKPVDYLLSWRPDTELWLDNHLEVVQNLQVEYPAK